MYLKHFVVSISLACGVFSALPICSAADNAFYLGGGVGRSRIPVDSVPGISGSTSSTDTGWKVFAGYQFHRNFAAEAGYIDFGRGTLSGRANAGAFAGVPAGTPASGKVEVTAFSLSGIGIIPFTNEFSGFGRLGLANSRVRVSAALGAASNSASDNRTDAIYGLGLQYNFTRNLGLRGEWERTRAGGDNTGKDNVDLYSINLLYRF